MISNSLHKLRNDIAAIIFLSIALFFSLALYSYNPADPSWNSIGNNLKPSNWCGYFGSFGADFFYQFFGMSSWILVITFFAMSYNALRKEGLEKKWEKQVWLAVLLISLASFLEIHFNHFRFYGERVGMGGSIGAFFASMLVKGLNLQGTTLFLASFSVIALIFITDWSLRGGVKKIFLVNRFFSRVILHLFSCFRNLKIKIRVPSIKIPPVFSIFNNDLQAFPEKTEGAECRENISDGSAEKTPEKMDRRQVRLKKQVQRRIANWKLPEIKILEDPPTSRYRISQSEVQKKSKILLNKLSQFSINGEITGAKPGPAVTLFEFKPEAHVKISKITELADDLSLALSSESVRIIAPIPGRDVVGIETSNANRETVFLKDIVANEKFWSEEIKLPLALGRQANGQPTVVDLRRMPHLLVAGTTGSGKSVFVVCALTGMLFRHSPKTLRLILIDPKQVDLSTFNDIPHLLMPTICEPKKAVGSLKWAVREMEKRYRSMSKFGSRGLEVFNEKVLELNKEEISQHEAYNSELEQQRRYNETYHFTSQPYIVIVVEEFGDLMTIDKHNVEQLVVRLAQMARASGIHLILAMQSPRKDVVTGLIKTNIPGRISFKVASKMDSRIILDEAGAERLLARGDMLFLSPGVAKPTRYHGPWVTENEIISVMNDWSDQGDPEYNEKAMTMTNHLSSTEGSEVTDFDEKTQEFDDRYDEILAWVATTKEVSASLIQRKFRIGYPRAARLIENMEKEEVIGPANGSKPRQVLVNSYNG